jgi:hypothetical protein
MHDSLGVRRDEHVQDLISGEEHFALRQLAAEAQPPCLERLSVEQLRDEIERRVVGDVIVKDLDCALVAHGIGEVALSQKATA